MTINTTNLCDVCQLTIVVGDYVCEECDTMEDNNYGHDQHCPLSPCICDA